MYYCCQQSAKVGASHGLNYISNGVGQGLVPAVRLLLMYDGLRLLSNENASIIKPSSDEEGGTPRA